ncbi:hypothetical protein ACJX0J_012789, partial [Zea mays]
HLTPQKISKTAHNTKLHVTRPGNGFGKAAYCTASINKVSFMFLGLLLYQQQLVSVSVKRKKIDNTMHVLIIGRLLQKALKGFLNKIGYNGKGFLLQLNLLLRYIHAHELREAIKQVIMSLIAHIELFTSLEVLIRKRKKNL